MPSKSHLSSAPNQTHVRMATKLGTEPCYTMGRPPGQARRAPGTLRADSRGVIENEHAGDSLSF